MKTFFFFWRALALVSLVLGLEHSCPWPRECLTSERLSLVLASDFFCVIGLGLEFCVLDSTSDPYYKGLAIFSLVFFLYGCPYQRWSPRGHILKSLALASKVKFLALVSRPQVLKNWPVLLRLRALALVSLVLGLEHSCLWPRECLSSERLSLALASDLFCVLGLGLEPCVLDSTSDPYYKGSAIFHLFFFKYHK